MLKKAEKHGHAATLPWLRLTRILIAATRGHAATRLRDHDFKKLCNRQFPFCLLGTVGNDQPAKRNKEVEKTFFQIK